MARDTKKNLRLSVNVEYDVVNFAKLPKDVQQAYDTILTEYGEQVVKQARAIVSADQGPGPHPHNPDHGFVWEDTEKLAEAVEYRITGRGFIRAVEIFVNAIQTSDGRLVDYGTFLEVGWHPMVPVKGGGVVPTGNFYSYPWISKAVAYVNRRTLDIIKRGFGGMQPLQGDVRIFGRSRAKDGIGFKASGFKINQTITNEIRQFSADKILRNWLKPAETDIGFGVKTKANIFFGTSNERTP